MPAFVSLDVYFAVAEEEEHLSMLPVYASHG